MLLIIIFIGAAIAAGICIEKKLTESQEEPVVPPFDKSTQAIEEKFPQSQGVTLLLEKIKQLTPEITPSEPSEIGASDWKVYKNEEYGFEFRYPRQWGKIKELDKADVEFENRLVRSESPVKAAEIWLFPHDSTKVTLFTHRNLMNCNKNNSAIIDVGQSRVVLKCNNLQISSGQMGIMRDDIVCSTGPTGAGICRYTRNFIIDVGHNSTLVITGDFERKFNCRSECRDDYDVVCLQKGYKNCLDKNKVYLEKLDKFMNMIYVK